MQVRHSHYLSASASAARRVTRADVRGFTLIELLVVLGIVMVITVFALPTIGNVVSSSRMRAGVFSVSELFHSARSSAIRLNTTKTVDITIVSSEPFAYYGDAGLTSISSSEAKVPVGKQSVYYATPSGTGAPSQLDNATAFGTTSSLTVYNDAISFNSRGMPCKYASGTCSTGVGFIWYFTFQPPFGSNRWGAISVSPAGRVKNWYWDGGRWAN